MPYTPANFQLSDYIDPKDKGIDWATHVVKDIYYRKSAFRLTRGKDVKMIRSYATGRQQTNTIKKSLFKLNPTGDGNGILNDSYSSNQNQNVGSQKIKRADLTGIDWSPVGILPNLLNSSKAKKLKRKINPLCTAIDPTSRNMVEEDMLELKNQKYVQAELEELSRKLKIKLRKDKTLKNGEFSVDIEKLDLDVENDEELQMGREMFYKLKVESAMEVFLKYDVYLEQMERIRNKLLDDHYAIGVSSYRKYMNDITGLPESRYYTPEYIFTSFCEKPDCSDALFWYADLSLGIDDVMKMFGSEIKGEEEIAELYKASCVCQKMKWDWDTFKKPTSALRKDFLFNVIYIEWKSWDGTNIVSKKTRNGKEFNEVQSLNYVPSEEKNITGSEQRWKQNTYSAYLFPCGDKVKKFRMLDSANTEPGKPSMSNFSISIIKSAERAPVELVMTLVDDWHRAFFKFQHTLLKSRGTGMNINLAHLKNAAQNLKEEGYTPKSLLEMLFQENILLTDSKDFVTGQEITNNPAWQQIPATNIQDMVGYLNIMSATKSQIREIMGIPAVIEGGTQANPEALVGIQKLALEASENATYFIDVAMKQTIEDGMRYAACLYQEILQPKNKNTPPYKTLMAFAGRQKAAIIESAHQIYLHIFGIKIEDEPTDAEIAFTNQVLIGMVAKGSLTEADLFAIKRIAKNSYKDAEALIVLRANKREKQRQKEVQQALMVQMAKDQGINQTKLQVAQTTSSGEITEEKVKGDYAIQLQTLMGQIQLLLNQNKSQQTDFQIDKRHRNTVQQKIVEASLDVQKEAATAGT